MSLGDIPRGCCLAVEGVLEVVVHLPRRLAPTHLLLSIVLTPNQARGGWRGVKPAVPPASTCKWAVLERPRRDRKREEIDQIVDKVCA